MTEEQFDRLIKTVERVGKQLVNIHAIEASTVLMQKIEQMPDAGAQATLEMLYDYFTCSANGEPMKPIPRPDLIPGKKA